MAVVVPYVANTAWADNAGGGTPITAAKLNVVEDGITNAHLMAAVRVTHNTSQSIASGSLVALAFNTERFDQAGGASSTQHDTVTNNTRLTCRYAGVYQISGCVLFGASAAGAGRALEVRLNGTTVIVLQQDAPSAFASMSVSTLYSLAVNDYVELLAFQDSGSAMTIASSGNYSPEFAMVRVA